MGTLASLNQTGTTEELPEVLTVPEAAKLLRLGRNTCYAFVAEGRVPSVRLGNRIVIPREALFRFLADQASRSISANAQTEETPPAPLAVRR